MDRLTPGSPDFDEDAFLGGEAPDPAPVTDPNPQPASDPNPTQAPPSAPAPAAQPTVPAPGLQPAGDQDKVGQAFATMEARYKARERELEAENERLRTQAPQPAPQPEEPKLPKMPDPLTDPDGFAEWLELRDQIREQRMQASIAPVQVQTNVLQAQTHAELSRAQTGYGWNEAVDMAWQEMQAIAPLLGIKPEQLAQHVYQSPDAGERILAMASASRQRAATAPQVNTAAVQAAAANAATEKVMAAIQQSPYNHAPPSLTSLPTQTVVSSTKVVPGSKEEDDLLAR